MREIAVIAFAQTDHRRTTDELSEVEMLMPVLHGVLEQTGLKTADIDFTCSGSSDYLAGRAFSFTLALDGVGATAADLRVARRDGRRLGALRGVDQAAHR